MSLWKRTVDRLVGGGKPKSGRDLHARMKDAYDCLNSEDYLAARQILLGALEFRDQIQDAPTVDWLLGSLEATWLFQDQFREQISFFSDYLERYPRDYGAYRGRASASWYLGKLDDAINDYSRVLELSPTDILSLAGRGQVFAELAESAKAIMDLDLALRLLEPAPKPDVIHRKWCKGMEAFVRRGRGVALAVAGQSREAFAEFEASISLSPDNAWVYYSRAELYERTGDRKALADYRTALEKADPALPPLKKERARAKVRDLSSL